MKVFGEGLGGIDVREYSSVDEAYADLAAGRLDAVAGSFPLLGYAASKRPEIFETVTPVFGEKKYFAWVAVKSEETESMIAAVNEILLKMQDDGRMAKLHENGWAQPWNCRARCLRSSNFAAGSAIGRTRFC